MVVGPPRIKRTANFLHYPVLVWHYACHYRKTQCPTDVCVLCNNLRNLKWAAISAFIWINKYMDQYSIQKNLFSYLWMQFFPLRSVLLLYRYTYSLTLICPQFLTCSFEFVLWSSSAFFSKLLIQCFLFWRHLAAAALWFEGQTREWNKRLSFEKSVGRVSKH